MIEEIHIYASNDFHGYVQDEDNSPGLAKFTTYFKEKGAENNTLLMDQGDTWQGSIYSNSNRGRMITDCMNAARFDSRTVGNHDFDWGLAALEENTKASYDGYSTPVLGANLYDYDPETKTVGTAFQSNLAQKSVVRVLENGLKVGIVGVIGSHQITSITSKYVENIAFTDHVKAIKDEATSLRNDEGCDIVIASVHAGQEDVMGNNLADYVDLVLCGHTHSVQQGREGSLYYAQFGFYGANFGHVTLTYNRNTKSVTNTNIDVITGSDIRSAVAKVDPTIAAICKGYMDEASTLANTVVHANGTSSTFLRSTSLSSLMACALLRQAKKEGYSPLLGFTNNARANIGYGKPWTMEDIYAAFPFDNRIFVIEVNRAEVQTEITQYNSVYRDSARLDEPIGDTAVIVTIDYLAFHTNDNRDYDYFPYGHAHVLGELSINFRDALCNMLKEEGYTSGAKTLVASDFSRSKEVSKDFVYA